MRPEGHSLDRIDPWGNYEPGNLRWADQITQHNNIRDPESAKKKMSAATKGRRKKQHPKIRCPYCYRDLAAQHLRYCKNNPDSIPRNFDDESRARMTNAVSAVQNGKPKSPEHRAKIAEGMRKRWALKSPTER